MTYRHWVAGLAFLIATTATARAQDEPLPQAVADAYLAYEAALADADADAALIAARAAHAAAEDERIDPSLTAVLAENHGYLANVAGHFEEARDAWRQSGRLSNRNNLPAAERAWRWHNAASNALLADDNSDAWACSGEAIDAIEDLDGDLEAVSNFARDAYFLRARLAATRGRTMTAGALARRLLELPADVDVEPGLVFALAHYFAGLEQLMREDVGDAAYHFHVGRDAAARIDADPIVTNRLSALAVYSREQLGRLDRRGEQHDDREAELLAARLADDPVHVRWYLAADEIDEEVPEGYVPAAPIERNPPPYPARAARDGYEGVVIVSFNIDETGRVRDGAIVDALPPGIFDEAALGALSDWRFEPATQDSVPVSETGRMIHFSFRFAD
ncbi:hypothetical protein AWH62_08185 [Maricaulis sp. W15]|uniref:Protein TonB n=1 Tax=Maricaulis maris TaxID=74318 RepID=A0A495DCT6_9PROT|nr:MULTISPECIES: energy transducer TonB [Maricaulis]OLF74106.1 hypothetical protein AWH62_08185 [Maricaulis sp. W15]RKR00092.1 TonB family protein [Maricaulis maris]